AERLGCPPGATSLSAQRNPPAMDDQTPLRTMVARVYKQNAQHIQADLEWLKEIIRRRYAERQSPAPSFKMPNPPALKGESVYQSLLKEFKFTAAERLALLLSLIPHIAPYFLDEAWQEVSGSSESALRSMPKTGTVPTIDFFLYLLAGTIWREGFNMRRYLMTGRSS